MTFKQVTTTDWTGKKGTYEILHIKKWDQTKYSVLFKNSSGDHEKQLVDISQLR